MSTNAAYIAWFVNTFNYADPRPANDPDPRYYRLWQMGVNVPIPNPHFTWEKKCTYTLAQDAAIGATHINFTPDAETETAAKIAVNLIDEGMYVLISNSTTKISEIARVVIGSTVAEYEELGGAATVKLYLQDALTKAYTDGNAIVEFYSPKQAAGWTIDNDLLVPIGIKKGYPTDLIDVDGKLRAQQLRIAAFNSSTRRMYASIPNLQEYARSGNGLSYRLGARYNMKFSVEPGSGLPQDAGTIMLALPGCTSPNKVLLNYLGGELHKYYTYNSYPAFNDWSSFNALKASESLCRIQVNFVGPSPTISQLDFGLDDIYLEHSAGFESSLGCLLLTFAPDRESLQIGSEISEELTQVSNADKYPFFPFGNPNKSQKYSVACTFTNSNMDTYQKLKILETWQNDGFNLNLHPHFPELPEVLIGRMKLGKATKSTFDFTRVSFDFEFSEV